MIYKKSVGGVETYSAPTVEVVDLAVENGIAISTPEFDDALFWEDEIYLSEA